MRQARGFTLVELMITVAIIAIVGSIAVASYRGYVETAQKDLLKNRVESFRMFQENWRADNGTYVEGTYQSGGGANDFRDIGYSVPNDDDGLTITVEACPLGIERCYKVTASDTNGHILTWEDGNYAWND